jgi:hypothetical protein
MKWYVNNSSVFCVIHCVKVEETELRLSDAEGTASIEQKLELIEKEEERIAKELADAALEVCDDDDY